MIIYGFKTCLIGVKAADSLKNTIDRQVPCQADIDNDPPEFVKFSTNFVDETGSFFIAKTTNLSLIFRDLGSGIATEDVFINLQNVKGPALRNPDDCVKDGNRYDCHLTFTTDILDAPAALTIAAETKDILGNELGII